MSTEMLPKSFGTFEKRAPASYMPSFITVTQSSDKNSTAYKEHCPALERPLGGYTAERLFDIIVGDQVENSSKCCRVPRGVCEPAGYVADTVALASTDVLSYGDGNGNWVGHTKPPRKYKSELFRQLEITSIRRYHSNDGVSPDPESVYTLYRNYFQHTHTPEFGKVIATLRDWH